MGKSKSSGIAKTGSSIGLGGAMVGGLAVQPKPSTATVDFDERLKYLEENYEYSKPHDFDNHKKYLESLDVEDVKAMQYYTGDDYVAMNVLEAHGVEGATKYFEDKYGKDSATLRNKSQHFSDIAEKNARLKKLLENAPETEKDVVLTRNIKHDDPWIDLPQGYTGNFENPKSSTVKEGGVLSGKEVKIYVPKGMKAGCYIADYSAFRGEKEFLLKRGLKYRVLKNSNDGMAIEILK